MQMLDLLLKIPRQRVCQCQPEGEPGEEFQKVLECEETGLVIFRYVPIKETDDACYGESYIIRNTKEHPAMPEDFRIAFERNKMDCPRCIKILEHVESLAKYIPSIESQDVVSICDHCLRKERPRSSCWCRRIVDKFLIGRQLEDRESIRHRIKLWLKQAQNVLRNAAASEIGESKSKMLVRSAADLNVTTKKIRWNSAVEVSCKKYDLGEPFAAPGQTTYKAMDKDETRDDHVQSKQVEPTDRLPASVKFQKPICPETCGLMKRDLISDKGMPKHFQIDAFLDFFDKSKEKREPKLGIPYEEKQFAKIEEKRIVPFKVTSLIKETPKILRQDDTRVDHVQFEQFESTDRPPPNVFTDSQGLMKRDPSSDGAMQKHLGIDAVSDLFDKKKEKFDTKFVMPDEKQLEKKETKRTVLLKPKKSDVLTPQEIQIKETHQRSPSFQQEIFLGRERQGSPPLPSKHRSLEGPISVSEDDLTREFKFLFPDEIKASSLIRFASSSELLKRYRDTLKAQAREEHPESKDQSIERERLKLLINDIEDEIIKREKKEFPIILDSSAYTPTEKEEMEDYEKNQRKDQLRKEKEAKDQEEKDNEEKNRIRIKLAESARKDKEKRQEEREEQALKDKEKKKREKEEKKREEEETHRRLLEEREIAEQARREREKERRRRRKQLQEEAAARKIQKRLEREALKKQRAKEKKLNKVFARLEKIYLQEIAKKEQEEREEKLRKEALKEKREKNKEEELKKKQLEDITLKEPKQKSVTLKELPMDETSKEVKPEILQEKPKKGTEIADTELTKENKEETEHKAKEKLEKLSKVLSVLQELGKVDSEKKIKEETEKLKIKATEKGHKAETLNQTKAKEEKLTNVLVKLQDLERKDGEKQKQVTEKEKELEEKITETVKKTVKSLREKQDEQLRDMISKVMEDKVRDITVTDENVKDISSEEDKVKDVTLKEEKLKDVKPKEEEEIIRKENIKGDKAKDKKLTNVLAKLQDLERKDGEKQKQVTEKEKELEEKITEKEKKTVKSLREKQDEQLRDMISKLMEDKVKVITVTDENVKDISSEEDKVKDVKSKEEKLKVVKPKEEEEIIRKENLKGDKAKDKKLTNVLAKLQDLERKDGEKQKQVTEKEKELEEKIMETEKKTVKSFRKDISSIKEEKIKDVTSEESKIKDARLKQDVTDTLKKDKVIDVKSKEEKLKDVTSKQEKLKAVTPKDEKLKDLTSKENKVKDFKFKEQKHKEVTSKEENLKDIATKERKIKDLTSKEEKVKEDTSKDEKLRDVTSKQEKPKYLKSKEDTVKDITAKDVKIKDVTLKEKKVKDVTSKENLKDILTKEEKNKDVTSKKDKHKDIASKEKPVLYKKPEVAIETKEIKFTKRRKELILELIRLKQSQYGPREKNNVSDLESSAAIQEYSLYDESDLLLELMDLEAVPKHQTDGNISVIIGNKIFKQHLEYRTGPEFNYAKVTATPTETKTKHLSRVLQPTQHTIYVILLENINWIIHPIVNPDGYEYTHIDVDPEAALGTKGIIRYALSDRSFIDKGWTMLPTEKVVRKINVYRMRPAHPEFDWFEHNKYKRVMQYDTGEVLADFDDDGRGRWFYRSGKVALDYYNAQEINAQQRFVVYSSGEPDDRGRTRPRTVLATFDYLGNGVVFDHGGKIRLKYNQTEGVVLDRSIGPVSNWKWHTLNDPPVLQQVMIDTQLPYKDPNIASLGSPNKEKVKHDNEEMLAIEFDNFIKEKSRKLTQKFKPFQIKMKALKINENFSLRVLDQATVYLLFRDGTTNIKINIGMVLDHKEIVDTDTAEVGEVSNSMERLPARTDSLAALQRAVVQAQHMERARVRHERRLNPLEPTASVDQLRAAASRPLRRPLLTESTEMVPNTQIPTCPCRKPSTTNLYYSTYH